MGRLSVRIFGLEVKPGRELAHHLGRALQLTNILRDLDETPASGVSICRGGAAAGRNQIDRAGRGIGQSGAGPCLQHHRTAARQRFRPRHAIMAASSRRAVRAPRIMGEVYRLSRMAERGFAPPRSPIRLGRARLAFILMRYAFI